MAILARFTRSVLRPYQFFLATIPRSAQQFSLSTAASGSNLSFSDSSSRRTPSSDALARRSTPAEDCSCRQSCAHAGGAKAWTGLGSRASAPAGTQPAGGAPCGPSPRPERQKAQPLPLPQRPRGSPQAFPRHFPGAQLLQASKRRQWCTAQSYGHARGTRHVGPPDGNHH